ncbi:FAR-RED IMPAIRED RESPONSE 1 [Hibiscus trionum]|uniref:Protein FAR1-RELATED SEQUENCE n=1 Tax=Hibiscus trionum TaxID=183268 RepID=A0A9W7I2L3_HIBTR|nr:FAR-RED IMPAIRED RESPONSE 1 [Hibiscus trionum]
MVGSSSDSRGRSSPSVISINADLDGLEFDSKEEAFSFYKQYAQSVGFSTIIKASRRSRVSGKFIDAKFVCTRYGNDPDSPAFTTTGPVKKKRGRLNRSWSKTDCKAGMHVKRRQDGRWVVCSFVKEHNHDTFPDQGYYSRDDTCLALGKNNVHAIPGRSKRSHVYTSTQAVGHKKLDCHKGGDLNGFRSCQILGLEEGDLQVLLDRFNYMQDENPNFFYALDLNEEQRLRNVFWIDAKARLDYGYFDDVVFFDTTYIKNDYKLPLVPFIGVNHHLQFLLLGCALVADQTKLTYVWLMRAWLRGMGGNAPKVILTDHDKALKEAVVEVFPDSCHCFCLWHILSKIPQKLSYVHGQHEDFMAKFDECIFKSYTEEQFENKWWELVDGFNLRNDLWFRSLYEDRQKWVPTYMRGIFLAGMSTMQRSDSVSSFFDRYLQRKTMLKEFLDQCKALLQEKSEEEAKADFETWHKPPGLKSPSLFEKQMASFYTHAVFKKFQVEVLGGIACHPRKESEEGGIVTFKVQDFEKNQDFIVVWNDTISDISCLCRGFEFNGFPCRHILIILQLSGVQSIPSQHILKRWTKDAKHRQTTGKQSDVVETRMQRYNDLCQRAFKLGDEGSLSQESYNIVFNALEEALRKCESVSYSIQTVTRPMSPQTQGPHHFEEVNQNSSTSKAVKKIKTSLKRQGYPETEISNTGRCNNWQQVFLQGVSNIRVPNLECSYESQESIHRMEQLNSRTPALDSCFGSQLMQGMGQLNSIVPPHDAHYGTQQRMNGMGQVPFRPQSNPSCYDIHGLHDMDQPNARSSQLQKQLHSKHISR